MVQPDKDNVIDVDRIRNGTVTGPVACRFSFLNLRSLGQTQPMLATTTPTFRKATSRLATSWASFSRGIGFGTFLESLVFT